MRATQTFQANINLLAKGTELARNGRMVVKAVVKTNAKRRRRHIDEEYRREVTVILPHLCYKSFKFC
jgi:hypothetical protein